MVVPAAELADVTVGRTRELGWAVREDLRTGEVARLRRGAVPQPIGWDMLTDMASPSSKSEAGADTSASADGLSAFVARVLDQLTLSAWLPAAVLTASLAVLLQFRSAKSANVLHAVGALTANPVRVLVIMIPLLVLATVVTQAFSFEAIRTLEGYWRHRGLASGARTIMIRWHAYRKGSINKRLGNAYGKALDAVKDEISPGKVSETVFNAFREKMTGAENKTSLSDEAMLELAEFTGKWRSYCQPWHLAKIDQLLKDRALYPDGDRILPTKLGNMMRATEDNLKSAKDDVEGFVLRRYALASRLVQLQHDQFRNRLDMYCTMVFVCVSLALLTPAILIGSGISALAIGVVSGGFIALCAASYRAAIASAGGYCAALKEMDKDPGAPTES